MLNTKGVKALILAAGFGTRLLPHTRVLPKPLFPINGRPILAIIIDQLIEAGVSGIAVNTHHLHDQIAGFLDSQEYPIPVVHRYEPHLLGTGGAVLNFADFLGDQPFIVINSDVLTDIDIRSVLNKHLTHSCAATLVLHDYPEFNKVTVNEEGLITGFHGDSNDPAVRELAFTGIQVLEADFYGYIQPGTFVSSIDAYTRMIADDKSICAHIASGHYWNDLGTPERYRDAVIDTMAPFAFKKAFDRKPSHPISRSSLAGDGSDRKWLRLRVGEMSLIIADHGIQTGRETAEIDAFVAIGSHLQKKSIPVAPIYGHDRFSGLVFLKDLGDTLLYDVVIRIQNNHEIQGHYRAVIRRLCRLGIDGAEGFDPAWAYQTATYSKEMIIEAEGLYFTRALVRDYLGIIDVDDQRLTAEFSNLAEAIHKNKVMGFMHRDMQSRNIMVTNAGEYYFIDYQGGRSGPLQYDLAALLMDPYTNLPQSVQADLLDYAVDYYASKISFDPKTFAAGYCCCAVSRTLQALGAYGFLTGVKKKAQFALYIPTALKNLRRLLTNDAVPSMPYLKEVVDRAERMIKDNHT